MAKGRLVDFIPELFICVFICSKFKSLRCDKHWNFKKSFTVDRATHTAYIHKHHNNTSSTF